MYTFEEIIGNQQLIRRMRAAIQHDHVFHAYILAGKKGMGKKTLAKTFAKALQCEDPARGKRPCGRCVSCKTLQADSHTDVIYVENGAGAKSIGVSDIREQIVQTLAIKPYKHRYKIYIIDHAEKMTAQAQNALLKTIEEPPSYGIFLLLADGLDSFLSTVLSRCVVFKLKPVAASLVKRYLMDKHAVPADKAAVSGHFSQGSIGRAVEMCCDERFETAQRQAAEIVSGIEGSDLMGLFQTAALLEACKATIDEMLDLMVLSYRDMLMLKTFQTDEHVIQQNYTDLLWEAMHLLSPKRIIRNTEILLDTKRDLRQNANFQLAVTHMLFKLKEK